MTKRELTPKHLKPDEAAIFEYLTSDPQAKKMMVDSRLVSAFIEALSECRGLLVECEWVSTNEPSNKYKMRCSKCRAIKPHHAPDCRIEAALKGVPR